MNKNIKIAYTRPQLLLSSWLDQIGLGHSLEEPFTPYIVDIYIDEFRIGIEVDSAYHISKKRDAKRDLFLKDTYGINVLHIDCSEIKKSNYDNIISKILSFVENF